ncbi:MAG: hypothetical protein OEY36_08980 [Gammaproteobacteria bacterium]|nr:hypothetical protein [Gammaproteobacteria bacterium]
MIKPYFLILALVVVSFTATAKDNRQQFATYGLGGESCAVYSSARAAGGERELQVRQWLAGYITAFNLIVADTYDIFGSTDYDGMIEWLDDRCSKYPRANLTNTVARFTEITHSYRKQYMPQK